MQQIIWTPGLKLEELETQVIKAAFSFYRGNKTSTANSLGIAIRTLEVKLKKMREDEEAKQEKIALAQRARDEQRARERGIPLDTITKERTMQENGKKRSDKERETIEDYNERSRAVHIGVHHYGMRS